MMEMINDFILVFVAVRVFTVVRVLESNLCPSESFFFAGIPTKLSPDAKKALTRRSPSEKLSLPSEK